MSVQVKKRHTISSVIASTNQMGVRYHYRKIAHRSHLLSTGIGICPPLLWRLTAASDIFKRLSFIRLLISDCDSFTISVSRPWILFLKNTIHPDPSTISLNASMSRIFTLIFLESTIRVKSIKKLFITQDRVPLRRLLWPNAYENLILTTYLFLSTEGCAGDKTKIWNKSRLK